MAEETQKGTDEKNPRLFIGVGYLRPSEGLTLRDALGVYSQPFIEHPESYPDLRLLDAADSFQTVTGIFVVRNDPPAQYLRAFYNGNPPAEITRVISSNGFRNENGQVLTRDELNAYYHRWFFGRPLDQRLTPRFVSDLSDLLENDEHQSRIVNYAIQVGQGIRIRASSNDRDEFNKLTDRLVRAGISGQYVEYLPPILFRDFDGELNPKE
ncbi:MAG: hypothetical protein HYS62_00710 [Candidatus Aenigmarchaeota archaeon]|nr:hypothetical protein [Candidatus Aenigmarchaeota archaeon]